MYPCNIDKMESYDSKKLVTLFNEDKQEATNNATKYVIDNLFKFHDDTYGYIKDGNVVIQKSIHSILSAMPKQLKGQFIESPIFYDQRSDIDMRCCVDRKKRIVNTFPLQKFNPTEDKRFEKIERILTFISKCVCVGKQDKSKFMNTYIKKLLHNRRTKVIPFLYGSQGRGKSTFIKILKKLLGMKRVQPLTMQNWADKFTSFVEGFQLLFTEENIDVNGGKNQISEQLYNLAINMMKTVGTDDDVSFFGIRVYA